MPKAKRKKPHNPARAHDRRARDLLRNAITYRIFRTFRIAGFL